MSVNRRHIPGMTTWEPASYGLQNRYQDGNWELMPGELFSSATEAVSRAQELSKDAIGVGMVRVITPKGTVYFEYGAGEGKDIKSDLPRFAKYMSHKLQAQEIDLINGITT